MFQLTDTTAAWWLHCFQINPHVLKFSAFFQMIEILEIPRDPHSLHFPSKRCTSYLDSPLEFAGASQAWHQAGRRLLWEWDRTESDRMGQKVQVPCHPWSSTDPPSKCLNHVSQVPGCPIPRSHLGSLMSGSRASASPAIHNADSACHEICVKTHEAKGWEEQEGVTAHSRAQNNVVGPNFVRRRKQFQWFNQFNQNPLARS